MAEERTNIERPTDDRLRFLVEKNCDTNTGVYTDKVRELFENKSLEDLVGVDLIEAESPWRVFRIEIVDRADDDVRMFIGDGATYGSQRGFIRGTSGNIYTVGLAQEILRERLRPLLVRGDNPAGQSVNIDTARKLFIGTRASIAQGDEPISHEFIIGNIWYHGNSDRQFIDIYDDKGRVRAVLPAQDAGEVLSGYYESVIEPARAGIHEKETFSANPNYLDGCRSL